MKRTIIWSITTLLCIATLVVALASRKSEAEWSLPHDTKPTGSAATHNAMAKRTPVLVELFTSEGCSSCPPADALLAKFAKSAPVEGVEIIPLAEHVDYWNHLGWSDPYSSAQFSNRQRSYAETFQLSSVYTPEMVVDGSREFVGSEDGTAREAIAEAAKTPKVTVQITRSAPGESAQESKVTVQSTGQALPQKVFPLQIHVDPLTATRSGEETHVILAITEDNLLSSVKHGENAGRNLTHIGVVRKWSVLGATRGQEPFLQTANVTLENGWKTENLHAVAFVQGRQSGKVYGAATVRLATH